MKQVTSVYLAALVQGLALVTFPAASSIFTSVHDFHLSNTQYGGLFIPQALLSIGASLFSAKLSRKIGVKRGFLGGLIANLISMLLLALSSSVMERPAAYGVLLLATACLGVGFGLMVPILNTLAASLFPKKMGRAILLLNALLGFGTALAPLLIALFVDLGFWWGLPLFLSVAILGLMGFTSTIAFRPETEREKRTSHSLPVRFWLFAAFALVYGMIETVNGNWATVYMKNELDASGSIASLALTAFWAMVTFGRLFFAAISKLFSEKLTFRTLPFIAAGAFLFSASLPGSNAFWGVCLFGLAGLGCSALLPLTISFADKSLPSIAASVAGGLIAFYLLGYGIAAFSLGPLQERVDLSLPTIFSYASILALGLGCLSFVVTQSKLQARLR